MFVFFQGLAGEAGANGGIGPRVSPFVCSEPFIMIMVVALIQFLLIHTVCSILLFTEKRNCLMSLYSGCPCREKEVLQEREVKLDPMACKDPKVAQVDQDQMDRRYCKNKITDTQT